MKKFICGFLVGAILCTVIGVFAATYVAETVSFKIFVDGEEFKSEKPALAIDGSTYLPLKAIGEALGVPVVWNNSKKRVEVGEPPKDNYISYANSNGIPDFGIMYNIPYVDKVVDPGTGGQETNVAYYYEFDKASDYIVEYTDLLKDVGYTMREIKADGWHNTYSFSNTDKAYDYFVAGVLTDYTTLKLYWVVTFNY